MPKLALKYGSIAAAIMIAVIILPFWLRSPDELLAGMKWGERIGYATMLLAMGLVYFAIREYRERHGGGVLGFGKGLQVGTSVSLVAALVFGLATVALYTAMGPERIDAFMRLYMEYMAGEGATPEALAKALSDYEAQRQLWLNPWFQGLLMFATVLPIGLAVSLVSAWLLRRR